jgi:alanyl-tRNA synthetase
MPPRATDDLRLAYLDFFKKKGHAMIPGASLIPENDPTVLFTTAGMHPLVPYLLGEPHPAGKRLVDVQRCVRTQDIDEVGDESHLTMFEMLGNWSLGDYFKEGAIEMSFEFLTKVLEIPTEMLAVTCFAGDSDAPRDDESARIWKKMGIPEERIGFLPKEKNWWGPAGKTGPCGPDTEMFHWVGDGKPRGNPETHEKEWLEIWNDVFMQYNKKEDGTFEPLRQQNVDTGMGLERVAAVLQGVPSVYDTDRMKPILEKVRSIGGRWTMDDAQRFARIVVDHLKAATFMIADGVEPSNVDRGYVLRKIIRRAVRSARKLGLKDDLFTAAIAEAVLEQYAHAYPHLRTRESAIRSALDREEEQFRATLHDGEKHLSRILEKATSGGMIDGVTAFHLYDTYGFPFELTKEIAAESGVSVDEAGFERAFEDHQTLSRAGAEKRFAGGLADHGAETTKLHTATHLLNAALRNVLGEHVWQKGSNVTAERLRFDFSHSAKMTPEQIAEVERLVNDAIERDLPVSFALMTVDEAKKRGAIGVFEERYGEKVKVYKMGEDPHPFSLEICGGPHVVRTGMLGSFKIQKEEAVSAGVRRIKATVSGGPAAIEVAKES